MKIYGSETLPPHERGDWGNKSRYRCVQGKGGDYRSGFHRKGRKAAIRRYLKKIGRRQSQIDITREVA